jgi:predicted TIM-barrel fold metal-dependent hydrolase
VFDRFPALQIITGHNLEILAWSAWRMDYGFPVGKNGGLKRTIKEYLRENFYGGILPGEYMYQEPGAMDKSWNLAYQSYLSMANTVGIDRVLVTTDHPYGNIKAARTFFEQMPISVNDKEKIAHLNAERLLCFGKSPALRGTTSAATSANDASPSSASPLRDQR